MAEPGDLWHVKSPRDGAGPCQHGVGMYPSAKHGLGRRWAARYRDQNGKQCSPTFARRSDAKDHLIKALADLSRGAYVDPKAGKLLFADYARQWLDRQTFDVTTRQQVERDVRLHLTPTLGKRELRRIKPPDVQALIRALQTKRVGSGKKKKMEPSTIGIIVGYLSAILDAAHDDEKIAANPCRARSVKRPKAPTRKIVPWEGDRTDAIRRAIAVQRPDLGEIVTVGEGLGLRIGEAFAIGPDDFDFLRGRVHVRRQIRRVKNSLVFALPKGGKERDVPLSGTVGLRVARHLEVHGSTPVTLPWGDLDGDLVTVNLAFTTDRGMPWPQNHFDPRVWAPALKAAGVPRVPQMTGFHQLRHRFASVVLAGGATLRDLADWLGHENPAFTLRVYSLLMPASEVKMKAAIDAAFANLADSGSAPDVRQVKL